MDLSILIHKSLNEVKNEFKKEENMDIIKKDLLNPVIEHIVNELYPYFIKLIFGFISLLFLLIIVIFLNIRIIYYK